MHQQALYKTPVLDSASPTGDYILSVYVKRGTGLLNIPTYVTICGDYSEAPHRSGKLCKVETHIDNNSANVYPYPNIWIFWKNNFTANIILLGMEQKPEVVTITFGKSTTFVQEYNSEKAQQILQENGVDIATIAPVSW